MRGTRIGLGFAAILFLVGCGGGGPRTFFTDTGFRELPSFRGEVLRIEDAVATDPAGGPGRPMVMIDIQGEDGEQIRVSVDLEPFGGKVGLPVEIGSWYTFPEALLPPAQG